MHDFEYNSILPIITRVAAKTISADLVKVQPLSAPTMSYHYEADGTPIPKQKTDLEIELENFDY